jgi:hypothetical protein
MRSKAPRAIVTLPLARRRGIDGATLASPPERPQPGPMCDKSLPIGPVFE